MIHDHLQIVENSFWARMARIKFKSGNVAMVLGKTIHLNGVSKVEFLSDPTWLAHEMVHVAQFKKYGFVKFLLLYFAEWVRRGYFNNKFEIEARAGAKACEVKNLHV